MAYNVIVRDYASMCIVECYIAMQKVLLLHLDLLSIIQAVNRYGTGTF